MFGPALRRAREERGLSQDEVGAVIGVGGSMITRVEGGSRNLSMDKMLHLIRFLDAGPAFHMIRGALEDHPVDCDPLALDLDTFLANPAVSRGRKHAVRRIVRTAMAVA